jgi:catechol 2,3-dioxygenase-like lactoylglutathione lyase family enzyme
MVLSVDHIELIVTDLDKTIKLFEAMGFKLVTKTPHHGGSAEMQLPGTNQVIFELHTVSGEENPGVNHIAFLTDDIAGDRQKLVNAGVKMSPLHLVKASGRTLSNFRDPSGFRLQFTDVNRVPPVEDPNMPEGH